VKITAVHVEMLQLEMEEPFPTPSSRPGIALDENAAAAPRGARRG
jgi:hypothetical protein